MRIISGCIGAAMITASAAFAADLPADPSTPVTLRLSHEFEASSYLDYAFDKDWWRVNLTKGAAYVLRGTSSSCTTNVTLYDQNRRKLKTQTCNNAYVAGFEYIAPYTGLYYLEIADNRRSDSYASYYYADAFNDCAGTAASRCTQALDSDYATQLQFKGDSDWRSVQLKKGEVYTASATEGGAFFLSIRRANGTILAYRSGYNPSFVFTAPTTGKYFVEVKATQDTYFGTTVVRYIVAQGNITARLAAERNSALAKQASRPAVVDEGSVRTLAAAKARAITPATPGGGS